MVPDTISALDTISAPGLTAKTSKGDVVKGLWANLCRLLTEGQFKTYSFYKFIRHRMHTKLTLRLDDELIQKAKAWAKAHRVSLSKAVAEFLARLPRTEGERTLSPWTRRLAGTVSRKRRALDDQAIRRGYREFLAKKHR
ncbi:MAG: DUF6364 family protein [Nitrospirota bacterium]